MKKMKKIQKIAKEAERPQTRNGHDHRVNILKELFRITSTNTFITKESRSLHHDNLLLPLISNTFINKPCAFRSSIFRNGFSRNGWSRQTLPNVQLQQGLRSCA
jgi:hypothetical protein